MFKINKLDDERLFLELIGCLFITQLLIGCRTPQNCAGVTCVRGERTRDSTVLAIGQVHICETRWNNILKQIIQILSDEDYSFSLRGGGGFDWHVSTSSAGFK